MTLPRIIRQPSAFLPLLLSSAALATVAIHLARYGPVHEADEGSAAHIWQLLMAIQLPIIALFAIRWLRQAPRAALAVLGLQTTAALAACAPVFLLKL